MAEKGLDSFFEMGGLSPRLAQGITAYVAFTIALILGYRLLGKVRLLRSQTLQILAHAKTDGRQWISAMIAVARTRWMYFPKQLKLLLVVVVVFVFIPLTMLLSTVLGLAIAELF